MKEEIIYRGIFLNKIVYIIHIRLFFLTSRNKVVSLMLNQGIMHLNVKCMLVSKTQ